MTEHQDYHELIKGIVLDTPPASVATLYLLGIPLNNIVVVLTAVLLVLRLVAFIYDRYVIYKRNKVLDGSDT